MTPPEQHEWWARNSSSDQYHAGPYVSQAEAIHTAPDDLALAPGDSFSVGVRADPSFYADADAVLDNLLTQGNEQVGDLADDWLDHIPKSARNKLQDQLTDVTLRWLAHQGLYPPPFFAIQDAKEYIYAPRPDDDPSNPTAPVTWEGAWERTFETARQWQHQDQPVQDHVEPTPVATLEGTPATLDELTGRICAGLAYDLDNYDALFPRISHSPSHASLVLLYLCRYQRLKEIPACAQPLPTAQLQANHLVQLLQSVSHKKVAQDPDFLRACHALFIKDVPLSRAAYALTPNAGLPQLDVWREFVLKAVPQSETLAKPLPPEPATATSDLNLI